MESIEIQSFNLCDTVVRNQSIGNLFIIGNDNSNKIELLHNLISQTRLLVDDIDMVVFTNEYRQESYLPVIKDGERVHNTLDVEQLAQIELERHESNPKPLLIVLDYHTYSMGISRSLVNLLMNSRHLKLSFIMACELVTGISPEIRANFDYVFATTNCCDNDHPNISNIMLRQIYDRFFGVFPTFKSFKDVFSQLNLNSCIVYSARENTFDKQITFM